MFKGDRYRYMSETVSTENIRHSYNLSSPAKFCWGETIKTHASVYNRIQTPSTLQTLQQIIDILHDFVFTLD